MKTYIFTISFFILSISAFCQQQYKSPSIDYLANDLKIHPVSATLHFTMLMQSVGVCGHWSKYNVTSMKANSKARNIKKVERAYRIAEENVNCYLDSLASYINMCPKNLNIIQYITKSWRPHFTQSIR